MIFFERDLSKGKKAEEKTKEKFFNKQDITFCENNHKADFIAYKKIFIEVKHDLAFDTTGNICYELFDHYTNNYKIKPTGVLKSSKYLENILYIHWLGALENENVVCYTPNGLMNLLIEAKRKNVLKIKSWKNHTTGRTIGAIVPFNCSFIKRPLHLKDIDFVLKQMEQIEKTTFSIEEIEKISYFFLKDVGLEHKGFIHV